jgi:hypothetical protein
MNVIDNTDAHRYELIDDGEVVAVEVYELRGDRIALVHTEVLQQRQGKGDARALVDAALADARRRGLGVLPDCSYVRRMIEQHPDEYLDLVPADVREHYRLPAA